METASDVGFQRRMVQHILEVFPDQIEEIPSEELVSLVAHWISEACQWGMQMEVDVEQFIELCACHEAMRDTEAVQWIVDILSYPGRSAQNKLVRLQERLIFGAD